eukprot:CFRG5937T1
MEHTATSDQPLEGVGSQMDINLAKRNPQAKWISPMLNLDGGGKDMKPVLMSADANPDLHINGGSYLDILNFSNKDIAYQLTLIELAVFQSIPLNNFLKKNKQDETGESELTCIAQSIALFNRVSLIVAASILSWPTAFQRAKVYVRFVKIADEQFKLNNHNGTMAIVSALNHSAIQRLKKTLDLVETKRRKVYMDDAYPSHCKQGRINGRKLIAISNMFTHFVQWQRGWQFQPVVGSINSKFTAVLEVPLQDSLLWEMSVTREPRQGVAGVARKENIASVKDLIEQITPITIHRMKRHFPKHFQAALVELDRYSKLRGKNCCERHKWGLLVLHMLTHTVTKAEADMLAAGMLPVDRMSTLTKRMSRTGSELRLSNQKRAGISLKDVERFKENVLQLFGDSKGEMPRQNPHKVLVEELGTFIHNKFGGTLVQASAENMALVDAIVAGVLSDSALSLSQQMQKAIDEEMDPRMTAVLVMESYANDMEARLNEELRLLEALKRSEISAFDAEMAFDTLIAKNRQFRLTLGADHEYLASRKREEDECKASDTGKIVEPFSQMSGFSTTDGSVTGGVTIRNRKSDDSLLVRHKIATATRSMDVEQVSMGNEPEIHTSSDAGMNALGWRDLDCISESDNESILASRVGGTHVLLHENANALEGSLEQFLKAQRQNSNYGLSNGILPYDYTNDNKDSIAEQMGEEQSGGIKYIRNAFESGQQHTIHREQGRHHDIPPQLFFNKASGQLQSSHLKHELSTFSHTGDIVDNMTNGDQSNEVTGNEEAEGMTFVDSEDKMGLNEVINRRNRGYTTVYPVHSEKPIPRPRPQFTYKKKLVVQQDASTAIDYTQ